MAMRLTTIGMRKGEIRLTVFSCYLEAFAAHATLRRRVLEVLKALPPEVQSDFLLDERFTVSLENFETGRGSRVFMAIPGSAGDVSRNVVLRSRLDQFPEDFSLYVIAHEFAHAYLRNGPWGDITDVEEAADALAATWGFARPQKTPWSRI